MAMIVSGGDGCGISGDGGGDDNGHGGDNVGGVCGNDSDSDSGIIMVLALVASDVLQVELKLHSDDTFHNILKRCMKARYIACLPMLRLYFPWNLSGLIFFFFNLAAGPTLNQGPCCPWWWFFSELSLWWTWRGEMIPCLQSFCSMNDLFWKFRSWKHNRRYGVL